jgi:uncharacterized membrane protein YbjE (DUF340 family)
MNQLVSMLYLFGFLGAGFAASKIRIIKTSHASALTGLTLYALLFFMGFRLGAGSAISGRLGSLGLMSFCFAALALAGTVLFIILFTLIFDRHSIKKNIPNENRTAGLNLARHFIEPLKLISLAVCGFLSGLLVLHFDLTDKINADKLTSVFLYALIFFIGFSMARSRINFKAALANKNTLIIPAGTVIGSIAGGLAGAFIFSIPPGQGAAVVSGFGWYSLSGVIITDLGDPFLGSAAFLSNLMRESLALLLIPLLGKTAVPGTAIGAGGATSMDVTLPLIERSCGTASVPLAILSGSLLSLLVPFIVPILFSLPY